MVLPEIIKALPGEPSLLVYTPREFVFAAVKLCRVLKFAPLVLTVNIVPLPELPPNIAVPNKLLPDTTKQFGPTPSPLIQLVAGVAVKLCRFLKPKPLV